MKRTLTALVLAFGLTLGTGGALATGPLFPLTTPMPAFTDVVPGGPAGGVWYDYQSVKTAVESGLMKGTGSAFAPGNDITLAEVATIAARINEKATGYAIPAQEPGTPWYSPALAVMTHIGVTVGTTPEAKATRDDFVRILNAALPDSMMAPINTITSLPDSTDAGVLRFYNAGLLEGRDKYGTFDGGGTLRRAECAAMVARMVDPALRKLLNLAYSPALPFSSSGMSSSSPFTQALYRQAPLSTMSADSRAKLCALAGIAPDTVMVTFDNLPSVTAQEFLPLLVEAVAAAEASLAKDGSKSSFWDVNWTSATGIARDAATQAKWLAVDICALAAILAENPNLDKTPCCEALEKFEAARHATLSDAAKTLDPKAFYLAQQNK